MITMTIATAIALGAFAAAHFAAGWGVGWSVFAAFAAFAAFQAAFGFFLRKRMMRDMEAVQAVMADGQKRLQAKMQRWQMRPPGSIQAAQKEIAEDTRAFVTEALRLTEGLRRYRLWVPMVDRQMATAQMQLNWGIKEFRRVDELMPKVLMVDPMLSAMKMARMYMLDRPTDEIAKVYAKAVRRLRYNQNVVPAACWSWILVKRGDADAAFKVLTDALKNSDDATLKRNHELLMNNRPAQFSNSALGDKWYALHLEEPKVRMQRRRF